jgi:hypothetical protein
VSAYPPGTKYFSGGDVSSCKIWTTPALSWATYGTWFAVIPYSPDSPGKMTDCTAAFTYKAWWGRQKFKFTADAAAGAASALNAKRRDDDLVAAAAKRDDDDDALETSARLHILWVLLVNRSPSTSSRSNRWIGRDAADSHGVASSRIRSSNGMPTRRRCLYVVRVF